MSFFIAVIDAVLLNSSAHGRLSDLVYLNDYISSYLFFVAVSMERREKLGPDKLYPHGRRVFVLKRSSPSSAPYNGILVSLSVFGFVALVTWDDWTKFFTSVESCH